MLKRKLFNAANLRSWAKSLSHSGEKEKIRMLITSKQPVEILTQWPQEIPAKINVSSPPSSPKKKRQKSEIVTTVLDPPPFLLPILELSPLCESSSEPENPIQCVMEEASPPDLNISSAGAQKYTVTGFYKPSPTIKEAQLAFDDLKRILRPPKKTAGYKDPGLDAVFRR
jgi:hypothetical protein